MTRNCQPIEFNMRTNGARFWVVATWHGETWTCSTSTRSRAKARRDLKKWEATNER